MTVPSHTNLPFSEGALHHRYHPAWTEALHTDDVLEEVVPQAGAFALPLVHAHPARVEDGVWGAVVLRPPEEDELLHRVLLMHTRAGETFPALVKYVLSWTEERAYVSRRTVSRDQCRGRVHLFGYERGARRQLDQNNWKAIAEEGREDTLDWVAVEAPWHF